MKKDSRIKRKSAVYKHTYWKVKKDTEVELVKGFFGSVTYKEIKEFNDSKESNDSEELKKKPAESDIDGKTIMVCETISNGCLREVVQTNSIEFV